jgi:DNA-binding NarL/FixJ family response regulator
VTTILVVAPTSRAQASLARLLRSRRDFHVVVAPPGAELADLTSTALPDVLLIEVASGHESALRRMTQRGGPPVLVVLSHDPAAAAAGALGAEARAILPSEPTEQELIAAIDAAMAGLVTLHPDALRAITPTGARRSLARARSAPALLTSRETEVLGMLAEGLGNKAIASRLGLSRHTVKFHVAAIFAKLDAASRTEAVTIGVRHGLILI